MGKGKNLRPATQEIKDMEANHKAPIDGYFVEPQGNKEMTPKTGKSLAKVSIKVEYKLSPQQIVHLGIERELNEGEDLHEAHSELYINCLESIEMIVRDLEVPAGEVKELV